MRKASILILVLLVICTFSIFVGCKATSTEITTATEAAATETTIEETPATQTTAAETTQKTFKVGVLWDFLQVERRVIAKNFLEKYAKELGFEIVFQNANGDEKLQLQQAENLITQGVDLIVILPQNADACGPIVEQAHKAGIKVIDNDRLIKNADVDYFVGMNNDVIGDLMADYVYKLKPTGNYALVCGAPTDPNVKVYKDGWMRVIGTAVDKGDIKIISDTNCENWDPNIAMKNAENFLTKQKDKVDVVLAMNDGIAGGVIQALKARNLNGKVLVTGQDGELAACQRIVEGDQTMTIWKPDDKLSKILAETIMKVLKGEELQDVKEIDNGLKKVPAVLMEPIVVDKNNMVETVIASGYHKIEDVYKNVPEDQWPKLEQ